ncbi:MAG TPA: DNA-3-methyladenine glycosylase [Streptosporangiaceae bacterium]|nr:DNA-3-methyladenine glycosylase [Streptosporangiaceae bacterium]
MTDVDLPDVHCPDVRCPDVHRAAPVLRREFFAGPSLRVAARLLGCVLEHETAGGRVAVLLTEVEAYEGTADPASHAYRGRTARNAVMFGPPGHAYVYFTYGMHFCVNLVCLPEGTASAVLLRAGRVIDGVPLAAARRLAGRPGAAGVPDRDLARGPARLCQALGIDRGMDGADVCDPASALRIRSAPPPVVGRPVAGRPVAGRPVAGAISRGPRVGVSSAASRAWRFWLTGDPTVSAYRPHVRRARAKPVSPPAAEGGTMHR